MTAADHRKVAATFGVRSHPVQRIKPSVPSHVPPPDSSSSVETQDQTQPHTVVGTFQRPDSGNDETNTHEGRLMISESRRIPVTDGLRAEIPTTTNRMIVLLIPRESRSSAMSSENREDVESEPTSAESFPRPYSFSFSPASVPATVSTPSPSVLEAAPSEGAYSPGDPIMIMLLTCNNYHAVTTTVEEAPLGLHHLVDYLIAKHPKVMSTVSNLLIFVGGSVLLPGVTAWVSGTIIAHPAVTVAGGVAVAVGKWLRSALNSAAAKRAAQARLRGQGIIEDGNGRRQGRMERGRLLFVEFVV